MRCPLPVEEYYSKEEANKNPTGPKEGLSRVIRGSSYVEDSLNCRSANRSYIPPDTQGRVVGFRVVAVPAADLEE